MKPFSSSPDLAAPRPFRRARRALVATFSFPDFVAAMKFVGRVARAAERLNHHPDIDIRYSKVRLALRTHDAGQVTVLDYELARRIARLLTVSASDKARSTARSR